MRLVEFAAAHHGCGARKFAARSVGDGEHHIQVAQQIRGFRRGRRRLGRLPGFQEQQRVLQNPLPEKRTAVAPGRVEFPGLPAREAMTRQRIGHPLAILHARSRHGYENLHRDLRGDLTGAHLLLNALGQSLHQRQSARHPTRAAVEAASDLVEAVTETLVKLRKQPALLQRRLRLREPHGPIQQQRFGFTHGPDHRVDGVAAELFESRNPLVAVNDQITVRFPAHGDHDDRRLLSGFRQRCQQPPLPLRIPNPQMFITTVELVKLQFHCSSSLHAPTLQQVASGIAPPHRQVCLEALSHQQHKPRTGIAPIGAEVCLKHQ